MATESRLVKFVTTLMAIESGWLAWLLVGFAVGGVALFVQRAWHLVTLWCLARAGDRQPLAGWAGRPSTNSAIGSQICANARPLCR